ncbi:MAG: hypothetical protein OXQ29_13410, partial [Rhodospirillaceae bacterium]|nr:hypothetical protein [Rhodospirillaceae bacterium]
MAGDDAIITSHLDGTRDLCGAVVVVFRLRVPIAALAEEYRSRFGVPKTCTRHWTPCRTKDATPDLVPAGVLMPKPNEGYRSRASTIVHRSVILDMTEFPIYIINL